MKIIVKPLTGKIIPIDTVPSDTIFDIKKKIFEKEFTKPKYQRLIFNGKRLNDNLTLADYNIIEGSTMHLVLNLATGNDVYFKDLDGNEIKIEGFCPCCVNGYYLKQRIIEKIPYFKMEYLHIFYNKKEIEDDKSIRDQDIPDGDFIDIEYKEELEIEFLLNKN